MESCLLPVRTFMSPGKPGGEALCGKHTLNRDSSVAHRNAGVVFALKMAYMLHLPGGGHILVGYGPW